jgi:hypothetical protein
MKDPDVEVRVQVHRLRWQHPATCSIVTWHCRYSLETDASIDENDVLVHHCLPFGAGSFLGDMLSNPISLHIGTAIIVANKHDDAWLVF